MWQSVCAVCQMSDVAYLRMENERIKLIFSFGNRTLGWSAQKTDWMPFK